MTNESQKCESLRYNMLTAIVDACVVDSSTSVRTKNSDGCRQKDKVIFNQIFLLYISSVTNKYKHLSFYDRFFNL